jgi:hypothetical protein
MYAKHILAVLAVVFITMALRKLGQSGGGPMHPQARTWFLVGGIFGLVSLWLFSRG